MELNTRINDQTNKQTNTKKNTDQNNEKEMTSLLKARGCIFYNWKVNRYICL